MSEFSNISEIEEPKQKKTLAMTSISVGFILMILVVRFIQKPLTGPRSLSGLLN
jgi:hypothetical protein